MNERTRTHLDTIITATITIAVIWWLIPRVVDLILWIGS